MRTTQKTPCIQNLLHKEILKKVKRKKTLRENETEYLRKAQTIQKTAKGVFITTNLPGNLQVFVPDGKDQNEVVEKFKKKFLSNH